MSVAELLALYKKRWLFSILFILWDWGMVIGEWQTVKERTRACIYHDIPNLSFFFPFFFHL